MTRSNRYHGTAMTRHESPHGPSARAMGVRVTLGFLLGCLVCASTGGRAIGAEEGRERPVERRDGQTQEGPRREGESGREPSGDFQPQTEREAALLQIILELRREMAELRREIGQLRASEYTQQPSSGSETPREGERSRYTESRDGEPPRRDEPRDGRNSELARLFARYDANRDGKVTYQEFLAMREGPETPQIRQLFTLGDSNRDGAWSLEEFVRAAERRRSEAEENRRDAPREGERPVRREGDREVPPRRTEGERSERGDVPRERESR